LKLLLKFETARTGFLEKTILIKEYSFVKKEFGLALPFV